MYVLMVLVFVLGYAAIALEHPLKIDKAASALITGVLCWTLYILGAEGIVDFSAIPAFFFEMISEGGRELNQHETIVEYVAHFQLLEHVGEIASILFFLLGAMTIVEVIDAHEGFRLITDRVTTTNRVKLIWILSILTFFFSAALDNLTTAIVMAALLKKLMKGKDDLWMFAGMVVLAANAGGAWSPIGDVTTIMLWIGGQVSAMNIILMLIAPSLVCMLLPLIVLSFRMKGDVERPASVTEREHQEDPTTPAERKLVFFLGVGGLLFVPIFKTFTHLPPFMGMLFSLGVMWVVTELIHKGKLAEIKSKHTVIGVLKKVDVPTIFFFLGILTAVAALQSAGHLVQLAGFLEDKVGNMYAINIIIGLLSSIVDNVPLVAGAMGMYDVGPFIQGQSYPMDHAFWEFLAYCAGTGGSCLIIGSAAGVAIMGIMKIDFIWYLKKITWLALIGYLAGAAVYILMQSMHG
ncbi:MAG: sodium:proton antiporter NhaD [Flavobacteriales bacterium]|nr:sodium:proton antiporter NhaD [Flavobacteriales bacterium]